MMVMAGNHSSAMIHYFAGRYPGKIGWLIGPTAAPKTKLRDWMPFALDNDAFSAWIGKKEWDEAAWLKMLEKISRSGMEPIWALVPDVVADKRGTLQRWEKYKSVVTSFGWVRAFAVQDGMTPSDVPEGADVVFVGGTDFFKWSTAKIWASNFPRVHVGRVNSMERLWYCEELGVESVDGQGWTKTGEDGYRMQQLRRWIEGEKKSQTEMIFT